METGMLHQERSTGRPWTLGRPSTTGISLKDDAPGTFKVAHSSVRSISRWQSDALVLVNSVFVRVRCVLSLSVLRCCYCYKNQEVRSLNHPSFLWATERVNWRQNPATSGVCGLDTFLCVIFVFQPISPAYYLCWPRRQTKTNKQKRPFCVSAFSHAAPKCGTACPFL